MTLRQAKGIAMMKRTKKFLIQNKSSALFPWRLVKGFPFMEWTVSQFISNSRSLPIWFSAILTIYLVTLFRKIYNEEVGVNFERKDWIKQTHFQQAESASTIVFHAFKFMCYATGLLGAALADSRFGKYRTILYIGMLYAIGQAVLALGAVGSGEDGIPDFPNM